MGLFRSDEVLGIAGETLSFILNASAETHPNEYMGFLRAEPSGNFDLERSGLVITDVLVVPGTVSDSSSATVDRNMKPNSPGSVGSVHSHPSGVLKPSDADLETFRNGEIHIIVGAPYNWNDWKAFDSEGEPISLDVLDVAVPDPEDFFDFTQDDIDAQLAEEENEGGFLSWLLG